MVCQKSPTSCEFAKKKTWSKILNYIYLHYVLTTIQLNFKDKEIKKKLRPQWNSNPQSLGVEATDTCKIQCAKKTAKNVNDNA